MRLIDADKLEAEIEELIRVRYEWISDSREERRGLDVALCTLEDAPTIDAEPVVRCKDCIYYHPFAEIKGKGECHIVEDAGCLTWYEDCDYCSYGERRSEDETH